MRPERGILDQVPGLHPDEMVAPFQERIGDCMRDSVIEGVNHNTVLLSARGASAVAEIVRAGRA